jgi:hypothetical protein
MSINEKIQEMSDKIEEILDKWGMGKESSFRDRKKAEIKEWFSNFQPSEFDDALLILEKIQYYDGHKVDMIIKHLSNELRDVFGCDLSKILFYPLGDSPASSGGIFLYLYRKELGLPENVFPYTPLNETDLSDVNALVFFDDIIGSGHQAVTFAKKNLQSIGIDKYYVSFLAFEEGLKKVNGKKCFKQVIVHEILSDELRAFSVNSQVFPDKDTKERIKKLCIKYGEELYKYPLGYDNSQALIVFPHNTPNNTLPIIWASVNNEKKPGCIWHPIWERKKEPKQKSNDYRQIKKQYTDKERRQIIADTIVTEHEIEVTDIDQSSANEQKVATHLKAKKVSLKRITQK